MDVWPVCAGVCEKDRGQCVQEELDNAKLTHIEIFFIFPFPYTTTAELILYAYISFSEWQNTKNVTLTYFPRSPLASSPLTGQIGFAGLPVSGHFRVLGMPCSSNLPCNINKR